MPDDDAISQRLRQLPSVNEVLETPALRPLLASAPRPVVLRAVRETLDTLREEIREGGGHDASLAAVAARAAQAARQLARPGMRRTVNATGIIIHTGLGRAVLPEAAQRAIAEELKGYNNLAADLETSQRASRDRYVADLLRELTGAEAATVVNNNAGGTLLVLKALAAGREVIVSRGQLVEIGGSFRIPEVMAQSGARLVEVGTTNKTHLRDYEQAIGENTALILRVHPSNYRIVGFTESVPLTDLVTLGHRHGLLVMDDTGSGALVDMSRWGFRGEPVAAQSIKVGADVVTFSADKLIGGSQGGVILGRRELVQRIKRDPLARALRCDKLAMVALEATLRLFLDPDRLPGTNPTYRMIAEPVESVRRRAQALARKLRAAAPGLCVSVESDTSQVGSGSVPTQTLPTYVVGVAAPGLSADELARRLRLRDTPIFTRVRDDLVLLDLRTVLPDEPSIIVEALRDLATPE